MLSNMLSILGVKTEEAKQSAQETAGVAGQKANQVRPYT
jgi:hypothetical protein